MSNKEKKFNGHAKRDLLTRYYYLFLKANLYLPLNYECKNDYNKYREHVLNTEPNVDKVERTKAVEMLIAENIDISKGKLGQSFLTKKEQSEFLKVNFDVFRIKTLFVDHPNGNVKDEIDTISLTERIEKIKAMQKKLPESVLEKIRNDISNARPMLCGTSGVYFYNFEYTKLQHIINHFNKNPENTEGDLIEYVIEKGGYSYQFKTYLAIKTKLEIMDYKVTEGSILDTVNNTEISVYKIPDNEPLDHRPIIFRNDFFENSKWDSMKKNHYKIFSYSLAAITKNQKNLHECEFSIRAFVNRSAIQQFSDFKKNIDELKSINIHFKNKNGKWEAISFFDKITYDSRENLNIDSKVKYKIHPLLAKYLLNLDDGGYVSTLFKVATELENSRNFYIFCLLKSLIDKQNGKRKRIEVIKTIEELNDMCSVKYRWSHLKRDIIKPAVELINEKTQLSVVYRPIKERRAYTKVKFFINYKPSALAKPKLSGLNLPESKIVSSEIENICKQIESLAIVKKQKRKVDRVVIADLFYKHTAPVVIDKIGKAIHTIKTDKIDLSKYNAIGWIYRQIEKKQNEDAAEKETQLELELSELENDTTEENTDPEMKISEDRILKQVYDVVINWNDKTLIQNYDRLELSKDQQFDLVSKYLQVFALKKDIKEPLDFHLKAKYIPEYKLGTKSYIYFLQAVLIMHKFQTKDYDISNLIQVEKKHQIHKKQAERERKTKEKKAAKQRKIKEEKLKNETELSESELKQLLKELRNENGKELDLNKDFSDFYNKLQDYAADKEERFTYSFIYPLLKDIFENNNNFYIKNHFSLKTLTTRWETILNAIKQKKTDSYEEELPI